MFKKLITSVALIGTAVSVSAGVLTPTTAFAAPQGPVTLNVTGGTGATAFNISLPALASCSGNGAANYRWESFIASSSIVVDTLVFTDGPNQPAGTFTSSLSDTAGDLVKQKFPGAGGLISAIPQLNLSSLVGSGITAGAYKIGIFCADLNAGGAVGRLDAGHFWETTITVSDPATMAWSVGAVPAAPVLGGTLVPGDQTLSGTFTHAASTPATTGYTVTAVPTPVGPTVTLPVAAGATTFSLTGLVNGTSYAVSVVATNTAGSSAASNTANGIPSPAPRPAVTSLAGTAGTGIVTLSWVAPTGVAPTGYNIAVSPTTGITGSPFTAAAGATSFVVTGTPGTAYTFTVTPNHTAPYVGTSASTAPIAPNAAQVIIQNVTVVRPAGALVLTQRCGVNGALPIEPVSPGFAALPAILASIDQVGTAPTLTLGGAPDPQFANYPNPSSPNYPTHCGVNLGTAQLVTSGTLAGQYYAANGLINQVTVSDTRDNDTGWTVNGTMSTFNVVGGGSSFSGNYLGWSPVVTDTSDLTSAGYDQTVAAGASVLPDTAAGLATPKALSSAAAGAGLGIASFDARLKLLIPVSARAGTYNGTLTFTVV